MTNLQRVILWLGCNGLILVWLLPPTYFIHSDGIRFESNWHFVWNLPHEWSLNSPVVALRLITVVLITIGFIFVFRPNVQK